MNEDTPLLYDSHLYYRLIALWILCETVVGGIIHGFRLPISGLIVGGCAIICICLIAYYAPQRGTIIKATIIVAVFKMMLSPQSPPAAYIAVFFQGAMGELLFFNKNFYRASCFALGIIAMIESGIQRIFVMTILFGVDFWKAVNAFVIDLTQQPKSTNYSLIFISVYILMHFIAGIITGWYAGKIPMMIKKLSLEHQEYFIDNNSNEQLIKEETMASLKKRKGIKLGLIITWIFLLYIYFQSFFNYGKPLLPSNMLLMLIFRSLIIILTWYFLISPLLMKFLKKWLLKKKSQLSDDISTILLIIPSMRLLLIKCWKLSSFDKGIRRLFTFCKIALLNCLHPFHA